MNKIPESFDVALQRDLYSAVCLLCPWATSTVPSSDNGWWFYSLRVHVWHFCPGIEREKSVIPVPGRGNPRQ